jgi:hypothetical protein
LIELGLVLLIQSGLGSPPLAPGGFAGILPKDFAGVAYTWKVVSGKPSTGLQFTRGLRMRRFQIDCFGPTAAQAMELAGAIDATLNGFRGSLPDPDSTYVDSSIREGEPEGPEYSDSARNYWVMLEYEVWYAG